MTIAIFCVLLYGIATATALRSPAEFSETENRVLAQRPAVNLRDVASGKFETDYETYLADQFVRRDRWIGLKTAVEKLALRREIKGIYLADDGYLIEKHAGIFTTERARHNAAVLAQFVQRYRERFNAGCLSVMIIPNAVNILRDKLPPFAPPDGTEQYLRGIAESLPKDVWVDTASILQAHIGEELFYRTDHHWRTLAAFYVYRAWRKGRGGVPPRLEDYEIETITDSFEGTIQSKLGVRTAGETVELFHAKQENMRDSLYDYSALRTKDKYAVFLGGNHALLSIQTGTGDGRKILVIKDSYANCFIPFMIGEFAEIDVLDLRYARQRVSRLIAEGGYTDLLVLYNASGFAEDAGLDRLLN